MPRVEVLAWPSIYPLWERNPAAQAGLLGSLGLALDTESMLCCISHSVHTSIAKDTVTFFSQSSKAMVEGNGKVIRLLMLVELTQSPLLRPS